MNIQVLLATETNPGTFIGTRYADAVIVLDAHRFTIHRYRYGSYPTEPVHILQLASCMIQMRAKAAQLSLLPVECWWTLERMDRQQNQWLPVNHRFATCLEAAGEGVRLSMRDGDNWSTWRILHTVHAV